MEMRTALPKNIRQIGDVRGKEKIYLEDYVMTYIRKKEKEEAKEYLGIFLGSRQEMGEDTCIFIRGILEVPLVVSEEQESEDREDIAQNQRKSECQGDIAQNRRKSESQEDIAQNQRKSESQEDMLQAQKESKTQKEILREQCRQYFPELEVQGCCVIGTYPTERMEQLVQMFPESANLLYHLQEQEETLYVTGNGQYERVKGYFVFYEQNRNMQEYMAEVFRENSVEQESLPDRAIKSFREKVKEKSLQKNTSMLKLASSFFVVVMLVIGAIAVNRVEEIRAIRNQGGDLTAENEAEKDQVKTVVSGAANSADSTLQNTAAEEQRLVNGALMQEGDAAQITDGSSLTASQVSDSASGLTDSQVTDSTSGLMVSQVSDRVSSLADSQVSDDGSGLTDSQITDGAVSQAGISQTTDSTASQTGIAQTTDSAAGQTGVSQVSDGSSGQAGTSQTASSSDNTSSQTGSTQTSGSASDNASNQTGTSQTSGSASDQTGFSQTSSSTALTGTSQESSSSSVTWQAGGPDSFWEEDLEASADTASQASAAASNQATAGVNGQTSAEVNASGEADVQEAASRQTQAAYIIKSGDTLAEICKRYYGSLDQLNSLCEVNGITDANVIMPGQKIVLP